MRWFDAKSKVSFHPSKEQGIFVKYQDEVIKVSPDKVFADDKNCTSVKGKRVEIKESEHILSVVYGLGITNILIEFHNCAEPPILDGSSKGFADSLVRAGFEEWVGELNVIEITDKNKYEVEGKDSYIVCEPSETFEIDVIVDFPKPIGKQRIMCEVTPENYINEIAFCRAPLRGSLDKISNSELNDMFVGYNHSKEALIYYTNKEYVTKLRLNDEVVRHKSLDFIGDLANVGVPVKGKFTCYKSGHWLHSGFVRKFV